MWDSGDKYLIPDGSGKDPVQNILNNRQDYAEDHRRPEPFHFKTMDNSWCKEYKHRVDDKGKKP